MMQQVTLQPGDYVTTKGMTEEQYHKVARAFMNAGARKPSQCTPWTSWKYIGWCLRDGFYFSDFKEGFGGGNRQLTIDQVLNATNAGNAAQPSPINCRCVMKPIIKETDMQNWNPEEGKPARVTRNPCTVLGIDRDQDKAAVKFDNGRIMLICLGEVEAPLTEEDRAVDEMARLHEDDMGPDDFCRHLYKHGYRKQPTEDMSDPANWRAGDWFECVDEGSTRNRIDYFTNGMEYKLLKNDGSSSFRYMANDGKGHFADNICFRFVRRP